jgi:hypothetical protein
MVKKKLVEGLISDGAKLLRELDSQNFPVESMFWVHLPDEDYWRLVIASPMVGEQGSGAGYRRLDEVLREIELAGITLDDISIFDPATPQFQSIRSLASRSTRLAVSPGWVELEDAIVYRWTGTSISAELNCDVSSNELNQFWEAERKRSNLPALLITSDERRVTLRFHPRHGSQAGIENVKTPFLIALHRPTARPGCQLTWLN